MSFIDGSLRTRFAMTGSYTKTIMKWPIKNKISKIPDIGSVGDFGFRRSFYYHTGVDIYTDNLQEVQAIEDGTIVNIEIFTGQNATPTSPWWNETWSIMIEGKSGVIGYCELKLLEHLVVGAEVKEGDLIGNIIPVLKKNKGNGTTMIHVEHYITKTRNHVTWLLDTPKPEELLNPRFLLEQIINFKG
jgi:hypothetical protein